MEVKTEKNNVLNIIVQLYTYSKKKKKGFIVYIVNMSYEKIC